VDVQTTADEARLDGRLEFDAAARRSPQTRFRYAFIYTYKPVLDEAGYRSFETTAANRDWCARNLPEWLGYGPAVRVRPGEEIRDTFARHGVRYLFIGKSGEILLGYPDTTQDADLFVEKTPTNNVATAGALREMGFELTREQVAEIERGKDFVQLENGPFDLDLANDGVGVTDREALYVHATAPCLSEVLDAIRGEDQGRKRLAAPRTGSHS
jgi:hypothetical protein